MRNLRFLLTACTAIALWLVAGSIAGARAQSQVSVGPLTGNGAPVRKTMRTLRDMRYRDMVAQRYDFSCGSAALASLLRYGYGLEVTEAEMIKKMMVGVDPKEVVRNGFSMLDMKRYVESIGLRGHGFRVDAQALYRLQIPVIALLDTKGYKHFVVVKGAGAGRVFVADPALGHRVMNERDFVEGWNGIVLAVVGDTPMREGNALVDAPQSPALARRLDALGRATAAQPLVELGLTRGDLF